MRSQISSEDILNDNKTIPTRSVLMLDCRHVSCTVCITHCVVRNENLGGPHDSFDHSPASVNYIHMKIGVSQSWLPWAIRLPVRSPLDNPLAGLPSRSFDSRQIHFARSSDNIRRVRQDEYGIGPHRPKRQTTRRGGRRCIAQGGPVSLLDDQYKWQKQMTS